jgi:hypothetical protein
MIAIAFWSTASLLVAAAALAGGTLLRSRNLVWWDVMIFTVPLVLWLMLSVTGLRPKSLANLIEPIIVAAVVLLAFSLRTFSFRSYSHKARSIAAVLLSCGVTIMLYVLVPVLSE